MKSIVIILTLLMFNLFACTGDCLTCHPNLVPTIHEDERHKPMLGCIECHTADPNSMAECGSDCFSCHPVEKIEQPGIEQHNVIRECRDCHLQLKNEMFGTQPTPGQSHAKPLKEFLLN
ncbi:MAG: hypothetical protein U9Q62_00935 [Campylobacterota bacterium]|nr:hypothetical protein [Campylobacterota bacterium]